MNRKYLNILELDKIVHMAAERAVCPEARQRLADEMPATRPEDVRHLLAQTDLLAQKVLVNGNPRLAASEGADTAASRAAKGGILSMGELLGIADALRNFRVLTSWFAIGQEEGERQSTVVDDLFYTITPQPALERDIRDAILSEAEMADSASDELFSLRRKIRATEGSIREKLDGVIRSQKTGKYLQEALVSIRNGRYVVPVKAEYKNEVAGVVHDVSASGGTLFVEPAAVVEANAKILQLKNQEQAEIERILGVFTQRVADIEPIFRAAWDAMLEIDKRLAKAELGLAMKGVCPRVNEGMAFNLVKARHPLLNADTVVPVDIALGGEYDTMVITGPNTGGKTVSLKTAGLLSAMAQMGYLLPAYDSTEVCVFSDILVDIGDEQSIEQSLSTFSGHMKNITDIFGQVNNRSLVLMDELGAGTDPAEGAALAIAIIERLRESGARIMATTHYAELKMFALETAGVQNAGSEFNIETLRPTYRLVVGVPGRSNAFLIGEKLGIPAEVIAGARAHMSSEQRRFETVLVQLEDLKKELKASEDEIERLRHAASHQLEEGKAKRDALIKQGEEELEAARRRAKSLTDEVENAAYGLMDEMKQLQKDQRASAAQKAQRAREIARREVDALGRRGAQDAAKIQQKDFIPLQTATTGQEVWVPEMNKAAIVVAPPDKGGMVEVRVGAIKTKLPLASLSAVMRQQAPPKQRRGGTVLAKDAGDGPRKREHELNLLGKTVDEALLETDQFVDNAVMAGYATVYIIHGRGTGALRTAITQHLRGNRSVKSYRLGRYGEGEDGVTVVELK